MKTWEKILLYPIGLYLWLTDGIKNMSKKWKPAMAMLMAVVMLCGMLPMTATAAAATKIKVAGTELIETGYYTVSSGSVGSKQDTEPAGGSGYVHWDAANHTLTLYGVTVDGGTTSSGIFANGDYTIKLAEGTNNTVCSGYTNAITCDAGSVTIEGPGTMNATGATNGIKAQYSVVIKANVTVTGNNGCGIVNSPTSFSNKADPVRIADTATVSVTGSTYGIGIEDTYGASPVIDSPNVTIKGGTAAFKAFPHGAPKLSNDIGVSAGENESSLGAYDSASYSTYKCVKTRNLATYTVSFDANGGDGSMGNATAIEGKEYTLPTCTFTAPANKTFKAWSVNGNEKQPGDKVVFMENSAVTAIWEDIPHTCSIEPVEKVWPDCENGGKEAYYKCEGCGKFFEDANGTTQIDNIATWGNLPKNGHAHGTEWKSDEDNHWNECACGDKANTAAHKDENADGKCDVCAYNVGLPTTPDGGNKPSDNPPTGDNTQLGLWFALMLISVCGLVAVPFLGTQKKGQYTR